MSNVNSGIDFSSYAIKLSAGHHESPDKGLCVMECVAYIAGEAHTDKPACADYLCSQYAILINDQSIDNRRQTMIKYVLRLAGSKSDTVAEQRFLLMINTAVKKFLPYSLNKLNLKGISLGLTSLPEITDNASLQFVSDKLNDFASELTNKAKDASLKEHHVSASRMKTLSQTMLSLSFVIGWAFNVPTVNTLLKKAYPNSGVDQVTIKNIPSFVFACLTSTAKITSDEEFNMHCELLDSMLALTDAKEETGVDEKLKELSTISNKHLAETA